MTIIEKIKDKYLDLKLMIPDGMWFVIKCSVISIVWIIIIC